MKTTTTKINKFILMSDLSLSVTASYLSKFDDSVKVQKFFPYFKDEQTGMWTVGMGGPKIGFVGMVKTKLNREQVLAISGIKGVFDMKDIKK